MDEGRLVVRKNETHSNVYAQLVFAYNAAFNLVQDDGLRKTIRKHTALVASHFLKHGFVVCDGEGRQQPHGDLSPRYMSIQTSRCLGALNLAESAIRILEGSGRQTLVDRLRRQKERLLAHGYGWKVGRLKFVLGRFSWPTTSSTWLNFQKLFGLVPRS